MSRDRHRTADEDHRGHQEPDEALGTLQEMPKSPLCRSVSALQDRRGRGIWRRDVGGDTWLTPKRLSAAEPRQRSLPIHRTSSHDLPPPISAHCAVRRTPQRGRRALEPVPRRARADPGEVRAQAPKDPLDRGPLADRQRRLAPSPCHPWPLAPEAVPKWRSSPRRPCRKPTLPWALTGRSASPHAIRTTGTETLRCGGGADSVRIGGRRRSRNRKATITPTSTPSASSLIAQPTI